MGKFSRRQIDDIFLFCFPQKIDFSDISYKMSSNLHEISKSVFLTFHANCLLGGDNLHGISKIFLGKLSKIFKKVVC